MVTESCFVIWQITVFLRMGSIRGLLLVFRDCMR